MNPDEPRTPREELEIKITALLMGQLPPEEAAAVEAQIAADPELAALHTRLARAAELLREARALKDAPTPAAPRQLSKERREKLLATFRGIKPLPTPPKTLSRPYPARPVPPFPEHEARSWRRPLILAATIAALIIVPLALFAPSLSRMHAPTYMAREAPAPGGTSDYSLLHVRPDGAADYDVPVPASEKESNLSYHVEPALSTPPSIGSGQVVPKPLVASASSAPSLDVLSTRSSSASGLARQPERVANIYLPPAKPDDNDGVRESLRQKLAKNEVAVDSATPGKKMLADNALQSGDRFADNSRWGSARDGEKPTIFGNESVPLQPATATRGDGTTTDGGSKVTMELQRRYNREQLAEDEAKRLGAVRGPVAARAMGNEPTGDVQLSVAGGIDARAFGEGVVGETLSVAPAKDAESKVTSKLTGSAPANDSANHFGLSEISSKPAEEGRKAGADSAVIPGLPTDFGTRPTGVADDFSTAITSGRKANIEGEKQLFTDAKDYAELGRYEMAQRKYAEILDKDPDNIAARKGREEMEAKKKQVADAGYSAARSQAMWEVTSLWERPYRRFDRKPEEMKGNAETKTAAEDHFWDEQTATERTNAPGSSSKATAGEPATRGLTDPQTAESKTELAGMAAGGGIVAGAPIKGIKAGDQGSIAPNAPAQGFGGLGGGNNYWSFQGQGQGRGLAGEVKPAGNETAPGLEGAEGFGMQPGSSPLDRAAVSFDPAYKASVGARAKANSGPAGGQPNEADKLADLNNPILNYVEPSAISEPLVTSGTVRLDNNSLVPAPATAPAPVPTTPAKPGERPKEDRAGAGVEPAQETFVNGFLTVRKAEELAAAGENQKALELYREASGKLSSIKQQWPNWQPELVEFRQKRTTESIARLEAKLEKGGKAGDPKADAKPASGPATEPPATPKPPEPPPVPQPEVSTKDNAFSTFSLNVSDVSFQLAAASLEKGRMPDAASARSEEFINALDYRDPEPSGAAPLTFVSERARYPFAHNRDLLRLSLKTAAAGRAPGRPLNLVLLVDNSGSMERADRVSILKESMRVLSQQLNAADKVSLITFSREPRLWADGVAGDKAAEATQRASEITPQGGTDLSAALDLGYKTALKHYNSGSISRVVLLTDGAANLGEVKAETLKAKVEAHRKQGVAFDCFGVGWEGYNDDLLEQLSRNGDGRYGFINTPESAAKEFAGQLAGALRVAASDVKVQVEFNPRRVTSYRQIGYAKHQLKKEQFRDNAVDAAELGAAESGNALYVVEVNAGGSGDIGIARARFKVPGTSDYRELEWTIPYQAPAPAVEQASSSLRLAATASAFSEWLAQSPYAAEVTTDRLLSLINGIPAIYGADPRPAKLEAMIRQAKSISGR